MSIASAIENAQQKVANAYTAISNLGGTLPATQDLANLASTIGKLGYPYSGTPLTYSQKKFSIPNINIKGKSGASNIALPDYTVVSSVDGCMGATGYNYVTLSGDEYNNFIKVGSPNINSTTGVVSGFGTSSYLNLPYAFNPTNNSWEIRFKFITNSTISKNQKFFHSCIGTGSSGRFGIGAQIYNSKFNIFVSSDGSSWLLDEVGTYTPLANTTYWVKVGWTGTEYYFEYSTDGETYTRDITYSSTSPVCTMNNSYIGIYSTSSFESPWLGSIYLSESSIYVNGSEWWSPQAGVPSERAGLLATTDDGSAQTWNLFYNNGFVLDTASTKSGYDWCGSITVPQHTIYPAYRKGDYSNTVNLHYVGYRVSGFNASKWITTNYTFSMTAEQFNQGFTIQCHFITPLSFPNGYQRLLSCGSTYQNGPYLAIKPNGTGFDCGLATGGSVIINIADTGQLLTNTEYWLRLTKPDSASDTVLQLSTDGTNWTTVGTSSTSVSQTISGNRTLILGNNPGATGEYFRGQIDLRDIFIEIAGTKVWQTLI